MKNNPFFKHKSMLILLVLFVLVLGLADYCTGHELSFFVFYFVPTALAAWRVNPAGSYLISILSSIVCFVCDHYSSRSYSSVISPYWNVTMRLLSFLTIAYATSKIRFLLSRERETLKQQLGRIKTLTGLIPICASCKRIRDDTGYWQRVEQYLTEHTDAEFTHGLCQECVDKLLKEAGIEKSSQVLPDRAMPKRAKLDVCWIRRKMSQIDVLYAILPRVWKSTT